MNINETDKGFTLIELAIVIVIIGSIVGGIVGGRSLIDSANRQALVTDVNGYETAINAYTLEYYQLPGDTDEASLYWPTGVQDGNGNSRIDTDAEAVDLWEHLDRADIISGSFDGNGVTLDEENNPYNDDFTFWYSIMHPTEIYDSTVPPDSWLFRIASSRSLMLTTTDKAAGASRISSSMLRIINSEFADFPTGISIANARKIDRKFDDANPLDGKIAAPSCTVLNTTGELMEEPLSTFSENYLLSAEDKDCVMFFVLKTR